MAASETVVVTILVSVVIPSVDVSEAVVCDSFGFVVVDVSSCVDGAVVVLIKLWPRI